MTVSTIDTEFQQYVFELWALKCNRKPQRVAALLKAEGHDITAREISAMSRDNGWAVKVRRMMDEVQPDLAYQTFSELQLAAAESIDYLRNVVNGNYTPEEMDKEEKPFDPDGYEPRHPNSKYDPSDPSILRARVEAAKTVMHMAGYSPTGTNRPEKPADPFAGVTSKQLQEMTFEELMEAEEARREQMVNENLQRAENQKQKRRN